MVDKPEPKAARKCWQCGKLLTNEAEGPTLEKPHCQSSKCDMGRECYVARGGKTTPDDDKEGF